MGSKGAGRARRGSGRPPSGIRRGYVFLTLFHIRQTGRPGLVSAVFSGALRGGFGESMCFLTFIYSQDGGEGKDNVCGACGGRESFSLCHRTLTKQ